MTKKQLTLCLIYEDEKVLLGMKKRGFGKGKWNGFGGKIREGESLEEAAKREFFEECRVSISGLDRRGILEFSFKENPQEILEVHIFKAKHFTGEPKETEEMDPEWFSLDSIPFNDMWPDDIHWMPLFFEGKQFRGSFHFGENNTILESSLEEVSEL